MKTLLLFTWIFCCMHWLSAQDPITIRNAGAYKPGKVRVNKEDIGVYNPQEGDYNHIRFRTFTVDSVQPGSMTFGNHYKRLKKIVKQDPEASIMLLNATHWERNQRISIAATTIGLAAVLIIPMDQKSFNIGMTINCVPAAGILVSYLFKRHWANKSIVTWNQHLEEGKFNYTP